MNKTVFDCSLLELPRIKNRAGNITAVENNIEIPFDTKRIFYLYDIPGGESRGAHAHKECHQCLVCVNGSVSVIVDNGKEREEFCLTQPNEGLHLPPYIWGIQYKYSSDAVLMVYASHDYDTQDYIRDYSQFLMEIRNA